MKFQKQRRVSPIWTGHLYQCEPSIVSSPSVDHSEASVVGQPGKQPSFAITLSIEGKMRAAKLVSWIKNARSLRAQFFDAELFADPAWDILLDLYELELRQVRVKTSCVGLESGIPPPTRLRWLKALEARGLIRRQSDPTDNRIVFISLSPAASGFMDALFESILAQRPNLQPP